MTDNKNCSNDVMANEKGPNKQDGDGEDDNKDTFEEFSGYTTLHGLRFVGDHTSFIPRRLVWLCLVLLSATLFTIQVVDRVQYFLSSPITVNFKVNYNDSLKFPAITICNQNAFKVSAAFEHDLDFTIENMFGDPDYKPNRTIHSNTTLDVLYTQLAHMKEDMILKCHWGNQECSAENFTMTLTSHGVCYTFNKVDSMDEALIVQASGVDHGLKLILNTEKYEKMVGPHYTDGIKVIATDQSEIPSVEEVGMAISAGTHATVGLSVLSLNNLEPPYGRCGNIDLETTNRYTSDSCKLECKTRYVTSQCGCRHFYMPDLDGVTPLCTVLDYFHCLHKTLENFNEFHNLYCDCPTSCVYNIYESSLSYAKKSRWESVFDGVQHGLMQQYDIKVAVNNAKEVNTQMNTNGLSELRGIIDDAMETLDDLKYAFEYYNYYVYQDWEIISNFTEYVNYAITERDYLYDLQIFIVEKNFIRGRDAMEERTFGVLCQNYHEFLTDLFHKADYLLDNDADLDTKVIHMLLKGKVNNQKHTAIEARSSYEKLGKAYEQARPISNYSYRNIDTTTQDMAIPKELLRDVLFENEMPRDSYLSENDIDKLITILLDIESVVDGLFYNNSQYTDNTLLVGLGDDFSDQCELYLGIKSMLYTEIIEKPARVLKERKETLGSLKATYTTAEEMLTTHMTQFRTVCEDVIFKTIPPFKDVLTSGIKYTNGELNDNITKFDIARDLSSDTMTVNVKNLEVSIAHLNERIIAITESLPIVQSRFMDIWNHLLQFQGDNGEYDMLTNDTFLFQNTSDVRQYIHETLTRFYETKKDFTVYFEKVDLILTAYIKDMMQEMKNYMKSHDMDDTFYKDNFLEVDVYFKELRSEQIDQQKAYDEFALLCDIGGSMGLFIGGSAITFFEVVDFLILCSVHKARRRKH